MKILLVAIACVVAAVLGSRLSNISDTLEDVWPRPVDRTAVLLSMVGQNVNAYRDTMGVYPAALHLAVDTAWAKDAWGRQFRYSLYVDVVALRSAGEDGRFESVDDLVQHQTQDSMWYVLPGSEADTLGVVALTEGGRIP